MRREPFVVDSLVHVVKRGARGVRIFQDEADLWRTLLSLCHFNDHKIAENWFRDLMDEKKANTLERASVWPERKPIVSVIAFTFLPNHFHLLLRETKKGGIASFMSKIGKGITEHLNIKYGEKGSVFQGPYRSKTIADDRYLRSVLAYIMVKNTFELLPGGLVKSLKDFDSAYDRAAQYPYSSLIDYAARRNKNPILDADFVKELFPTPQSLKNFSKDYMLGRAWDPTSAGGELFIE